MSTTTSAQGVDHVVLLKFKPGTSQQDVEKFQKGIESLVAIPGVLSAVAGETFCEESWMDDRRDGYTHYLRVRLESKDALRVYQDHELHVKVKQECVAPFVNAPPLAVDCASPMVFGKT